MIHQIYENLGVGIRQHGATGRGCESGTSVNTTYGAGSTVWRETVNIPSTSALLKFDLNLLEQFHVNQKISAYIYHTVLPTSVHIRFVTATYIVHDLMDNA